MPKYRNYSVETYRDLREMLHASAEKYPNKAVFLQKKQGAWRGISYRRYLANVNALGTELLSLGLGGKTVLLMGENGVSWTTAYMAVICGVGTVVPLSRDTGVEELARIAALTEAAAVICSEPLISRTVSLATNVQCIAFSELPALISKGKRKLSNGYRTYLDADLDPAAMAEIVFTPGDKGPAKGVMLSHRSLCHNLAEMRRMVFLDANDLFLSVLPLHHAYECTLGFLCPLSCGATVAFSESLADISESMKEVHPSVMLTIPSLLESMYRKILLNIQRHGMEKRVADLIKTTNAIPAPQLRLSSKKTAFKAIHASFGGHMRLLLTIGDAISPAVLAGFFDLGLPALQAYGLSECGPLAAINRDSCYSLLAAGLATPNTVIDIADMQESGIGEIRIKGDHVMLGYYKQPDETAAVLRRGWFYTGDLGRFDKNGFLHIVGNKRNMITLANGAVLFPEEAERLLCRTAYVREALVVGQREPIGECCTVVALLYPDYRKLKEEYGNAYSKEIRDAELRRAIADVNAVLPPDRQIGGFRLRSKPFARTASGKLVR